MKKILAFVLPLLLTVLPARADVIFHELFQYTNGPIVVTSTNVVGGVMVTNWIRYSGGANPSDMIVNNNRLEVSSSTTYLGVTTTRQDDCGRLFALAPNSSYTNSHQLIYASFIVNFTNPPTAAATYIGNFKYGAGTSTSYEGRIYAMAGNLPNTYRLGVAVGSTISQTYTTDLALNTDYQVVLEWDPVNLYAISLWINPISYSDLRVTSNDAFTPTAANIADMFGFRQASGFGGFFTVSNMVVATSFSEAVTNVLATNAVAPQIVYQPIGVTNYVGTAISLSAVANGQGLGGLTYQWRQNGNPYPGGNANILNIPSAAQSDSGNYTLVVTTPYGLSVTSSVAPVQISVSPVPPTITQQPASNTVVYANQTVVLNVVAIGPPSLSYQWYFNNSPLSDNAIYSGTSSDTLTIYDVATANGNVGTYRVDVTNPNGTTPSSNAVISVIVPQVVSIAYLHTLVDPVTYAPTNVPPTLAYQVTGTVTTFTNLTTGNTFSYYLQDGTAGINIFATFGSTFRPAQGDSVTFIGVLSSYTTGLELYADTVNRTYTSYTINSSGNPLPTPIAIPFDVASNPSNANYNLSGSLVKLSGVYFGTNSGLVLGTNSNNTVTVTNSSGKSIDLFFAYLDQDTAGQTLPSYASSVTGVLTGIGTSFNVTVTRFADIVTSTIPVLPIPLSTVYTAGNLTFNWSDASFSLQSSTNVAGPYTTISGAGSGFSTNTASGSTMFFRLYHP